MKKIKGNHKHLTLSDRINIEKGLLEGKSFRQIAKGLNKDPSTISKEVKRRARAAERKASIAGTPIPCKNRKDCSIKHLCGADCDIFCKRCNRRDIRCDEICPAYEHTVCPKLEHPPYVCNGCGKRASCLLEGKIYSSKYADDNYREILVTSREGINQTPESIQKMNDIITPLIRKGQSVGHIYATHAEEISCSRKTLYTYIDHGVFDIGNLDMRRVVRYKKRKRKTSCSAKDREHRQGHNYEDLRKYLRTHEGVTVVEMDTVVGKKNTEKVLLTMLFRNCNLMLIFLLNSKTQAEVKRIFDFLSDGLGEEVFHVLFPVILTDGGSEFTNRSELEITGDGVVRTCIYYCDPYSSWQKGALEKNHEYIRYVLPKGKSFDELTEDKVRLLMNHINSEKRDSLNGHSPYELSRLLLDNRLHSLLGLEEIHPDEVNLKPELIR